MQVLRPFHWTDRSCWVHNGIGENYPGRKHSLEAEVTGSKSTFTRLSGSHGNIGSRIPMLPPACYIAVRRGCDVDQPQSRPERHRRVVGIQTGTAESEEIIMSNAIGSIRKSRRSKTVASGAGCSQPSSNAIAERCVACLELLLAYVETGNDWVELKTRSALGPAQSTSAQLQCARRRKTEARRHFLLH